MPGLHDISFLTLLEGIANSNGPSIGGAADIVEKAPGTGAMMEASDESPLRNARVRESQFKHQCAKEFGGLLVVLGLYFWHGGSVGQPRPYGKTCV
jgi:hypothetical protein